MSGSKEYEYRRIYTRMSILGGLPQRTLQRKPQYILLVGLWWSKNWRAFGQLESCCLSALTCLPCLESATAACKNQRSNSTPAWISPVCFQYSKRFPASCLVPLWPYKSSLPALQLWRINLTTSDLDFFRSPLWRRPKPRRTRPIERDLTSIIAWK
jgi:hypothetical protein